MKVNGKERAVPAEGTIEYIKNGGFEDDFSGNWYVSATVKPQVSNEIYHSGAASLMLTGETAVGEYPEEAMAYLVKTAEAAGKYLYGNP